MLLGRGKNNGGASRDDDTAVTLHRSSHSICKLPLFPLPSKLEFSMLYLVSGQFVVGSSSRWKARKRMHFMNPVRSFRTNVSIIVVNCKIKRIAKEPVPSRYSRNNQALIYTLYGVIVKNFCDNL